MKKIIFFFILATGGVSVFAQQQLRIDLEYPSFTGDFYVTGRISFPPVTVASESNIAVKDSNTGEEIPTKITVLERWPDGSVLDAEILFPANVSRKRDHLLFFGNNVQRKRIFTQTAVLPVISAAIGGAPRTEETMDIDVGEMIIKVDRSPEVRYYWHLLPIALLIFFSIYRARKNYSQP